MHKLLLIFNLVGFYTLVCFGQTIDATIAQVYLDSAKILMEHGKYDKALLLNKKSLEKCEKQFGTKHLLTARAYNDIAYVYHEQGEYDKPMTYLEKALAIRISQLKKGHPDIIETYNNIALIHRRRSDYVTSFNVLKNVLKKYERPDYPHPNIAETYSILGFNYRHIGHYAKSIECHQKELKIKISTLGQEHFLIGETYNSLGEGYSFQGDYAKAIEFHQKALKIYVAAFGKNHPRVSNPYYYLGIQHSHLKNYHKSIKYLKKALGIRVQTLGKKHSFTLRSYYSLGMEYFRQKNYKEAIDYLQKVVNFGHQTLGTAHPYIANAYSSLGMIYWTQGNNTLAIQYHQKALTIRFAKFKGKHHTIVNSYHDLGLIFLDQQDTLLAFDYFKKAINAAGFDWKKQSIKNLQFNPTVLATLEQLAVLKAYDTIYTLPKQEEIIYFLYQISDHFNQGIQENVSRFAFKQQNYPLYERSLQLAQTWSPRNIKQEFFFAEKSKATVLLSEIRQLHADSYRQLPNDLQHKDRQLKLEITQYEKQKFELKQKDKPRKDSLMGVYESEIFKLKREHEVLVKVLKEEYPAYYNLKYNNTVATVEEIQDLLSPEQALIEYFVGDSIIFIFVITPADYTVTKIPKNFPLEKWIQEFRESIFVPFLDIKLPIAQKDSLHQQYMETAYQLHQRLIASISIKLPKQLIIIPDGVLGYLPFDALLTESINETKHIRDYPYLLRNHYISYNYSATLFKEIKEKEHRKPTTGFLAFAPSFEGTAQDFVAARSVEEIRNGFSPLKYTVKEVEQIQNILGGDIYMGKSATEATFRTLADQYQIVHLSTHGKANDKNGDYSYLAFAAVQDSIEVEKLYVRDLYGLELNADMVVLSACETGLGELQRGEGIIGLTRGFTFAGAKSIMTSLWGVNDKSTQQIMTYFYENLKVKHSKDEALQLAKLEYLENTERPNPFFWAAFVPIGDMSPLELSSSKDFYLWLIGILMVTLIVCIFYKKRPSTIHFL